MRLTTRDKQARCAALGFHPGPIDGARGKRTNAALRAAMAHCGVDNVIQLFHPSGLHRIHWHWTAGAVGIIDVERDSYNELIDHDAKVYEGTFPPIAQATYKFREAASHTKNCNTGAIGLAVDCMAEANESPFYAGTAPMTPRQLDRLAERTAYYCQMYSIPVSRYSTLSHAEIQPTLGVRQRWKWDITWLPGMERPGDPIEVGDRLREMVRRYMDLPMAA
ncbi:N-acetylmuramoyl-L-alanine amidase [uncultured Ruegeria sp.]|uniref:peptidoglycan recognition protein family protein n=1 Tax=uncultured Ruegeria sp. TaxID=259304 RepID=UPI00260B8524|nr:N-acetylmuramoyl-L-alanine amidase [uncultured Ruegeria sp.]